LGIYLLGKYLGYSFEDGVKADVDPPAKKRGGLRSDDKREDRIDEGRCVVFKRKALNEEEIRDIQQKQDLSKVAVIFARYYELVGGESGVLVDQALELQLSFDCNGMVIGNNVFTELEKSMFELLTRVRDIFGDDVVEIQRRTVEFAIMAVDMKLKEYRTMQKDKAALTILINRQVEV
jgi:hypothetical protein